MTRIAWARGAALIVSLAGLLAASAGAQPLDPIIPGSVIVRLLPGASLESVRARHFFPQVLRSLPGRDIYEFATPGEYASDDAFEAALDNQSAQDLNWAEINYFGDAPEASGRNFFLNQTAFPLYFDSQLSWTTIGLPGAQAVSRGAGVVIAVVDSGVDAAHPELAGRISANGWSLLGTWPGNADFADVGNSIDDDGDGDVDEIVGHGTHVASIAAHIAPDATILPVRILNSDGDTDIFLMAAGIYYAVDHGAQVINVSAGTTYRSDAIEDAVRDAALAGAVVVAAGGNVNTEQPEEYPAMFEFAVGVAAVDANDVRASFANFNPAMALAAPGVGIHGAIPGGLYAEWNGSSFAAPMVSGAAALLVAHHPEWGPTGRAELVSGYLRASALNIDALNPGYAGRLGDGRLDAVAALELQVLFQADGPLASGGVNPSGVTLGDIDADFYSDMIVANRGSNTISVFRNRRDGSFDAPVSYPMTGGPSALKLGDVTGDGRPDIVATCGLPSSLKILRNNGGGAFVAGAALAAPLGAAALALGDFNHDGALDAATANEDADSVAIFLNDGSGSFAAPQTIVTGDRPLGIAAADFDGDNDLDLAAVNRRSNSVTLLRNAGGVFSVAGNLAAGADPRALAFVDLDGDNLPDIATVSNDDERVTLFWNGGGTFGAGVPRQLPLGSDPNSLLAVRMNCDALPELVVLGGEAGGGTVLVQTLLNQGERAFGGALPIAQPSGAETAAASDLDRDGDTELVVVDEFGSQLAILRNASCTPGTAGDTNCDGTVNFFDIDPFVTAIVTPDAYDVQYPDCDIQRADVNGDAQVDFFDIDPFVAVLFG